MNSDKYELSQNGDSNLFVPKLFQPQILQKYVQRLHLFTTIVTAYNKILVAKHVNNFHTYEVGEHTVLADLNRLQDFDFCFNAWLFFDFV